MARTMDPKLVRVAVERLHVPADGPGFPAFTRWEVVVFDAIDTIEHFTVLASWSTAREARAHARAIRKVLARRRA